MSYEEALTNYVPHSLIKLIAVAVSAQDLDALENLLKSIPTICGRDHVNDEYKGYYIQLVKGAIKLIENRESENAFDVETRRAREEMESGICADSAPLEVAQVNVRLMEQAPVMLEVLRDLMNWGGAMSGEKLAKRMAAVKKAREIIAEFEEGVPA